MKTKTTSLEKADRGFDEKKFWRHYVATVDTDHEWEQERPQQGRGSNRLFLFLLLFHVFLIASVVLFNLVADRPKPVFVDNSAPPKTTTSSKKTSAPDKPKPAAPVIAATKQGETVEHRVAQGDSLKSIADTYGATQEEIAKLNHIDANTALAVGSVLQVPKAKAKSAPAILPAPLQPSRVEEKVIAVQTTTAPASAQIFAAVEPAPTPKKTEIPAAPKVEAIVSKPPQEKPKAAVEDAPPASKPKPAETKAVAKADPPKPTEAKAQVRPEAPKSSPPAKASEPAKPAATPATSKPAVATTTHTVKPKETFYSISRKYGVKVDDLMRLNGVTDPSKLREGVVLKVPGR